MLAQRAAYGRSAPTTYSVHEYLRHNAAYFAAVEGRPRVSLWRDLCSGGSCAIERDGRPLYMDGHHLARSAVSFAVPALISALRAATPRKPSSAGISMLYPFKNVHEHTLGS
ncbi:SGNH hydrolase domain-containing protein [Ramlibacter montanisoli]|uniref:SGNH hydrolase domain-containing protein n=1 Tax=Ramlibacter montanisoli TaxID=2732512 RepID=UPI0035A0BA1B